MSRKPFTDGRVTSLHPGKQCQLSSPVNFAISYLASTGTSIFGLRFGFTNRTPVSWKVHETTKASMKSHQVWTRESNSASSSGNLVHAGFTLMKAPITTHTIRYLQSLRNRLPENTPFCISHYAKGLRLNSPFTI